MYVHHQSLSLLKNFFVAIITSDDSFDIVRMDLKFVFFSVFFADFTIKLYRYLQSGNFFSQRKFYHTNIDVVQSVFNNEQFLLFFFFSSALISKIKKNSWNVWPSILNLVICK